MAGRSSYTAAKGERIASLITEGHTLRQIEASEGISRSSILRWLRAEPGFRLKYSQAFELWAEMQASDLIDIAADGSNDWIERENAAGRVERIVNHENIHRSRLRVDTIKWLMAHRLPKKYGDLVRHTGAQGDDAVAITVDDEERRRKAREAIAEKFSERSPETLPPTPPPPVPEKYESIPREFAADGPLEADPDVARLPTRYRPPRIVGDWSS